MKYTPLFTIISGPLDDDSIRLVTELIRKDLQLTVAFVTTWTRTYKWEHKLLLVGDCVNVDYTRGWILAKLSSEPYNYKLI